MKRFTKGDRVLHATYGTGTLGDVDERHTVINFDEHGTRLFMTSMVVLESTQVAAPARPAKAGRKSTASRSAR